MGILLVLVGGIFSLAALVCYIIILIHAFQNAIWKGVVGLLCGLYLWFYGFTEFQHEKKIPIVLTAILGGLVGGGLSMVGSMMMGGGG
ncbi:MAG: hypothetical protein ACO1SX_10625 [Actinomycetota bacterium]